MILQPINSMSSIIILKVDKKIQLYKTIKTGESYGQQFLKSGEENSSWKRHILNIGNVNENKETVDQENNEGYL